KEATSKALGVGFSGFAYTEIEVTNLPSGAPTIKLTGQLADWAHLLGALRWHLTLSDTRDTAYASVLVEGPDDYPRRPPRPPPPGPPARRRAFGASRVVRPGRRGARS